MNTPPRPSELLADAKFRTSSYSEPNQNCVEIARNNEAVGVRDSKIVDSPVLAVSAEQGIAFLQAVKEDAFVQ